MESNFGFLESNFEKLATLANYAEEYAFTDPQAALIKLRGFSELLVGYIYTELSIEIEPQSDLFTKLRNEKFQEAVGSQIVSKLHFLRTIGNKAAHFNEDHSTSQTVASIHEAFLIGKWFIKTMNKSPINIPDYQELKAKPNIEGDLIDENNRLREEMMGSSRKLSEAHDELAATRKELEDKLNKIVGIDNDIAIEAFKEASKEAASSFDLLMHITRKNISIFDSFSAHSLTQDQNDLIKKLDDFLNTKKISTFLLKGYAGTGKTFITEGLTQYLSLIGRQFVLMASTGKAAKVISDKSGQEASTIHRVIYNYDNVKEFKDDDLDGSETFRCYAEIKVNQDTSETVYIIDESSMLSNNYSDSEFFRFGSGYLLHDLLSYINLDHNDHTKKVIFIGDNAQLPPVGMNFSPALSEDYLLEKYRLNTAAFELTDVVRQNAESGIMNNALILRKALVAGIFNQLEFSVNQTDVRELGASELVSQFLSTCDNQIGKTKDSIIIASSNSQVSQFNKVVREHFFPLQTQVVARDKVISVANHYLKERIITNGEFGMVSQVLSMPETRTVTLRKKAEDNTTLAIKVELQFRDVELAFRDETGEVCYFNCKIVENLLYNDQPSLSSDESKALYVDFVNRHPELRKKGSRNEFKLALLNDPYFNAFKLKFGYAITCHKAQGSEWKNVFLKCSSHHKTLSQDYFRWLYTAITRTSSSLFVLDPPKVKLGQGIKKVDVGIDQMPMATFSQNEHRTNDRDLITNADKHTTNTIEPSGNSFLDSLYSQVHSSLIGTNISIQEITHKQYQEVYLCQFEDSFATVRFIYNLKQKISAINFDSTSELDSVLFSKLSHLQGRFIKPEYTKGLDSIDLPEPFLVEFHKQLQPTFKEHEISITEVKAHNFFQRYSLQKLSEYAVVDIYYNKSCQITKYMPHKNLSSSSQFLFVVERIIAEALG